MRKTYSWSCQLTSPMIFAVVGVMGGSAQATCALEDVTFESHSYNALDAAPLKISLRLPIACDGNNTLFIKTNNDWKLTGFDGQLSLQTLDGGAISATVIQIPVKNGDIYIDLFEVIPNQFTPYGFYSMQIQASWDGYAWNDIDIVNVDSAYVARFTPGKESEFVVDFGNIYKGSMNIWDGSFYYQSTGGSKMIATSNNGNFNLLNQLDINKTPIPYKIYINENEFAYGIDQYSNISIGDSYGSIKIELDINKINYSEGLYKDIVTISFVEDQ